ncbi:MAG: hypothetical protein V3T14_00150 [Myxococcota bacterium]
MQVVPNFGPDVVPPPAFIRESFGPLIVAFTATTALVMIRFPHWSITSWWRDPLSNSDVGGDLFSQHLVGLAFDADGPEEERIPFVLAHKQVGHVTVPEETHVHWQSFPAGFLRRFTQPQGPGRVAVPCP